MENSNTNQMELKDDKYLLENEKSNSENQSSETNLPSIKSCAFLSQEKDSKDSKELIKEFSKISMSSLPFKRSKKESINRRSSIAISGNYKIKLNAKMDFVDFYTISSNDGARRKSICGKGSVERSHIKMKKKNIV